MVGQGCGSARVHQSGSPAHGLGCRADQPRDKFPGAKSKMKMIASRYFLSVLFLLANLAAALSQSYDSLKTEAEKFYADKSFAKAHELYARMMAMSNISSNDARWVSF